MASKVGDRYELLHQIGRGAMGVVYLAHDQRLDRQVAVKLMSVTCELNDELRQRFELEARRVAALAHPNILTVFDSGEEENRPYFVTEYIEGQDLQELLHGPSQPPLTDLLPLYLEVCDGLFYAHGKGVVHRDLKPSNIRITLTSHAKIMDFGIARLVGQANTQMTAAGMILGTPEYLSPEAIMGQPVDHRADIFAMGVLLYENLTRRRAFERSSAGAVMLKILQEEVDYEVEPLPTLPAPLLEALRRSLVKDPSQRIATAAELAGLVHRGLGELQGVELGSWRPRSGSQIGQSLSVGDLATVELGSSGRALGSGATPPTPAAKGSGTGSRRTLTIPIPSWDVVMQHRGLIGAGAGVVVLAAALLMLFLPNREPAPATGPETAPASAGGTEAAAVAAAPAPVPPGALGSKAGAPKPGKRVAEPGPVVKGGGQQVAAKGPAKPAAAKPAPVTNQRPEILELVASPADGPIQAGTALKLEVRYRDPDGDQCQVVWRAPQGGRLTGEGPKATLDTGGLATTEAQVVSVTVSVIDGAGAVATMSKHFNVEPAFSPRNFLVEHDHADIKFWSTKCQGRLEIQRDGVHFSSGKHVLSVADPGRLQVQRWKDGVEIVDRGDGKVWHFKPAAGTPFDPTELINKLGEWTRYKQSSP